MKNNFLLFPVLSLLLFLMSCGNTEPKIVYVDSARLYNEFTLTQELTTKMNQTLGVRKQMLDSLELEAVSLTKKIEMEEGKNQETINLFNVKRDEYLMKKQQFEEDNQILNEQYNTQITQQLNQYVNEFGKQNGYDVILGATGDGGIMYANKAIDVTDNALKFINERYNGNPITANK